MTDPEIRLRRAREKLERRKRRVHKKIVGTAQRPRLVIYRSNRHIYAQLVDDEHQRTITGCSSLSPEIVNQLRGQATLEDGDHQDSSGEGFKVVKVEMSRLVGRLIAKRAIEKGITQVVFDRNGRKYHGRIKALAEGAREGGLQF